MHGGAATFEPTESRDATSDPAADRAQALPSYWRSFW